jgi:hypothetical protein
MHCCDKVVVLCYLCCSHVVQKRESGDALAATLASLMGSKSKGKSKTRNATKDSADNDVEVGTFKPASASAAELMHRRYSMPDLLEMCFSTEAMSAVVQDA